MANTTVSQIKFGNNGQLLDIKPLVDYIYPVGAIYVSTSSVSPATLFGGTWSQIKGKFLLSADTTYTAGTTGGSTTVALETANLPSHSHSIGAHAHSLNNHTHTGPSHTHSGPSHTHGLNGHTHSGPSHSHTRGSMNITGTIGDVMTWARGWCNGAFTKGYANLDRTGAGGDGTGGTRFDFNASRTWSGSTSAAGTGATGGNSGNTTAAGTGATGAAGTGATGGPSVTNTGNSAVFNSGATGSGTAHNNMPPYLSVYMWERTA